MFAWLFLILYAALCLFLFFWGLESLVSMFAGLAPELKSSKRLREAVIDELRKIQFNSVCDNGSGFGGMCKSMSKNFPGAKVYGIEIMPIAFLMSRILQILGFVPRRVKFIRGNYFRQLEKMEKIDVGVFYQIPQMMKRVEREVLDKFKYLVVLDFPLPNVEPVSSRKLHHDFFGQHRIFVYKKQ